MEEKLNYLKDQIKIYPDFPKKGILFRDIFSLLLEPKAFQLLKDIMITYIRENIPDVEAVAGLESRGFLFGSFIAIELQLPFVPIRKSGKLPGELARVSYQLEYGTDTFEMQKSSIKEGQKVLIIDDLLATGGTLGAGCKIVEDNGGEIAGCLVVMELVDLEGRKKLKYPVHSLMEF